MSRKTWFLKRKKWLVRHRVQRDLSLHSWLNPPSPRRQSLPQNQNRNQNQNFDKIKTKFSFIKSYHVKFFRICLEQIFLGLLVNILSHMYVFRKFRTFFSGEKKNFSLYLPGSSKAKRNNIFKLKKKYWSWICNFRFDV